MLESCYEALEIPETGSGTLAQYAHWTETKAVQDMKTLNDRLSILGVCGLSLLHWVILERKYLQHLCT